MNNNEVIQAWIDGRRASNGRVNLTTNGKELWSYRMLIGVTTSEGEKCALIGYTPYRVTATTARHCSLAVRRASLAVTPVLNHSRYAIYNRYVFPAEILAKAGEGARALPYDNARVSMY